MKCKKIANDIDKLININIKFSLSNKTYYIKVLSTIDIEILNEKENFNRELMTCRPLIDRTIEEKRTLYNSLICNKNNLMLGIFLEDSKFEELKIIGRISLYDYNSRNLSFEIGFLLLSKYKDLGIMTVALKSVIKHLFTFGVVNKIYAQTCELNKNSIKLLERSNFKQDGRLREHHKIGDRLVDDLIYSILSKDFVEETVDD